MSISIILIFRFDEKINVTSGEILVVTIGNEKISQICLKTQGVAFVNMSVWCTAMPVRKGTLTKQTLLK